MTDFPYGAVLKIQREWTVGDIFAKLDQMASISLNTVVMWPPVFWWEDRSWPDYPYHTGRALLGHAAELGMKVIVELSGQLTALEYAPDAVMKDEYYATGATGTPVRQDWHYGYLNYNHPEVKDLIRTGFAGAAEHYRQFASLYGYDIWNETMFSSYDAHTLALFREWLRSKYGSIEALNEVWDRTYADWDQIGFTNWMWASVMPVVDFGRFRKENIGILLAEWCAIVKAADPLHPVLADNIHSMITENGDYGRPHDDWNVAGAVDEFGLSFYPKNVPPYMSPATRCETFTAVSSATRTGRFWVSEMQTNTQSMFTPSSVVYPWELRQWNLEALSRGAKGIVYWKWDPFSKGLQTSGRGLVDWQGNLTERAREAQAIKRAIDAYSDEFCRYRPPAPRWAILYDGGNHDFVKALTVNYTGYIEDGIDTESIRGLYECLWRQDIPVAFVTAADILAGQARDYDVIFSTCQICVPQDLAAAIAEYVQNGGRWISDGRFGFIDEFGAMYPDVPAGPLSSQLGWAATGSDVTELGIAVGDGAGATLAGFFEKLSVNLAGDRCTVTGRFSDGAPAVLKTALGAGCFVQIATYLWYGYAKRADPGVDAAMAEFADRLGARWLSCDHPDVRVSLSADEDGYRAGALVFAFNYSATAQSAVVRLPESDAADYRLTNVFTGQTTAVHGQFGVDLSGHEACAYKLEPVGEGGTDGN